MYEPQRLHPASILDYLVHHVYSLLQALLPLILLAFTVAGSRRWLLLAIPVMLVLFIIYGIVYWFRYIYYINGQELRLEYGVFIKKQRYIPFERVQSVQISAGILQRLFGLVKIEVETAGGGNKAEFVLNALPRQKAETLREILQAGGKIVDQVNAEEKATLFEYRLPTRSLLLLASTSNGIGVVLSALLVVISQLDDFFSKLNIWARIGKYAEGLFAGQITMIILAVFALLLLAWLLSLLGTIIRFAGFHMVRDGDNIKISRGLLEKQQLTLPIKRIQAIKLVEGILRQPFGMVSIQVVSISNINAKGEGNVLFPLLPRTQVTRFLEAVVPEFAMTIETQGLPLRSRNRFLLVNAIPALLLAILGTVVLPWGYLAFLLVPLAVWLGNTQYKGAGWQLEGNKLLLKSRIIGKVSTIVSQRRIQSMDISCNFLQKRRQLSTLCAAVASGGTGTLIKLKGMDEADSQSIVDWYHHKNFPV